jgi:hypothetical protein
MEAMVTLLIGTEGSGLATLKEALTDVVQRILDRAMVCPLNKALQSGELTCFFSLRTALNQVIITWQPGP